MRSVTLILLLALVACSGSLIFVQGQTEEADVQDTSEADVEDVAADADADEEDSSEDDAEELAADDDADEQDDSEDDAEELAEDPDADEQDDSEEDAEELEADDDDDEEDEELTDRALRGARRIVVLNDLDLATLGAAKKKKKAAKKPAAKKVKKTKAKKAPKKAKKKKKVSKIAKGKMRKVMVFKGAKVKTTGGLKKADLIKGFGGKIVSKKASAASKKKLGGWLAAVAKARKALGTKGFVAIKKGSPLYVKAKSFYKR